MEPLDMYVINLERQPHRRERFLELNRHWTDNPEIRVQFFKAHDGREINIVEWVERGVFGPSVLDPQVFNRFIAGNVLSQRDLWLKCVASGRPVVVLEDDAVLNHAAPDFLVKASRRDDYDIILAGYNFDSNLQLSIIPGIQQFRGEFMQKRLERSPVEQFKMRDLGDVRLFKLDGGFGVPCYLISPKGARRLLSMCFPFEERLYHFSSLNRQVLSYTLDLVMNRFYPEIDAYACLPPVAIADNLKTESSCTPHESNNVNIFMF